MTDMQLCFRTKNS